LCHNQLVANYCALVWRWKKWKIKIKHIYIYIYIYLFIYLFHFFHDDRSWRSKHNSFPLWLTVFLEKRFSLSNQETSTTKVIIHTNFFTDLYALIGTGSFEIGWYITIIKHHRGGSFGYVFLWYTILFYNWNYLSISWIYSFNLRSFPFAYMVNKAHNSL